MFSGNDVLVLLFELVLSLGKLFDKFLEAVVNQLKSAISFFLKLR